MICQWLPARELATYHTLCLCLLKRVLVTGEPIDIADALVAARQLRERSTRQDANLALPCIRSEAGRKRFRYRAVSAFNELPPAIKAKPPVAFKRHIKKHLGHF